MTSLMPALTSLSLASTIPLYEAQRRHPDLAAFSSMDALFSALRMRASSRSDALLRAMITEYASSIYPSFWSAALLVAMSPMLLRMRARFSSDYVSSMDIDQLIVEYFLDSLKQISACIPPHHVAMHLRLETRKRLYDHLQRVQNDFHAQRLLCEQILTYQFNPFDEVEDEDQTEAMAEAFTLALQHDLSPEQLQLLRHTLFQRRPIRAFLRSLPCEYAAEAASEAAAEAASEAAAAVTFERRYQATKRQHSRLIKLVRRLLSERLSCSRGFVHRLHIRASQEHHHVEA